MIGWYALAAALVVSLPFFAWKLYKEGKSNEAFRLESQRISAEIFAAQRAEQKRWKPVFAAGCYEYQQHACGLRRALRIHEGESCLDRFWLSHGETIQLEDRT